MYAVISRSNYLSNSGTAYVLQTAHLN